MSHVNDWDATPNGKFIWIHRLFLIYIYIVKIIFYITYYYLYLIIKNSFFSYKCIDN